MINNSNQITDNKPNYIKYLLSILIVILLIVPIILQYVLKFKIISPYISIYGIYLLIYICIQLILSLVNNISKIKELESSYIITQHNETMNIMVVGYKENPNYFSLCINSLKESEKTIFNINKILLIVDGNDPDDYYMKDKFMEVFNENSIWINLENLDNINLELINHLDLINQCKYICITQPHKGKRYAMYTGFIISQLANELCKNNTKTIFCTDSDTIIKANTLENMFKFFENTNIGAVSGDLSIYNKYDSIISFFSNIRYWYSFNVERAYQSYNNCVLCVSGPCGMYKLEYIQKIAEEWVSQKFLGKPCSYGDDRHLTNKILSLKKAVIFFPNYPSLTETPSTFYRFFQQQTRWNKSAFRELFWSVPLIDKHSLFMVIDLIYIFIYPYIVMGYLFYILWSGKVFDLGIYFCIVLGIGLLKSIYGCICSKNFENIFYFLYVIPYITIVFPSKIWAMITITDVSWGTSSRKIISKDIHFDFFMIILYNLCLLSGFGFCIYNGVKSNISLTYYYPLIITTTFYFISFLTMILYVKYSYLHQSNKKLN